MVLFIRDKEEYTQIKTTRIGRRENIQVQSKVSQVRYNYLQQYVYTIYCKFLYDIMLLVELEWTQTNSGVSLFIHSSRRLGTGASVVKYILTIVNLIFLV